MAGGAWTGRAGGRFATLPHTLPAKPHIHRRAPAERTPGPARPPARPPACPPPHPPSREPPAAPPPSRTPAGRHSSRGSAQRRCSRWARRPASARSRARRHSCPLHIQPTHRGNRLLAAGLHRGGRQGADRATSAQRGAAAAAAAGRLPPVVTATAGTVPLPASQRGCFFCGVGGCYPRGLRGAAPTRDSLERLQSACPVQVSAEAFSKKKLYQVSAQASLTQVAKGRHDS